MPLFVYGTLRHPPLLDLIAGAPVSYRTAKLPDYVVERVENSDLPMIMPRSGGVVDGLLLENLTAEQESFLDAYEVPFGYTRAPAVAVRDDGTQINVDIYLPPQEQLSDGTPWSLDNWVAADGQVTVLAAQEINDHVPRLSPSELSAQWHMIRMRAAARARAETTQARAEQRRIAGRAEIRSQAPIHGSFFKYRKVVLSHETFDGHDSEDLQRELLHGSDVALVLAYDRTTDCVLLVEQFRVGPFLRHDQNPWLLEPIAGIVDDGETPAEAAIRETKEEAGLDPIELQHMFDFYPSPGGSTDFFHCYLGFAELGQARTYFGGLNEEAEDLRLHVMSRESAMNLIETGEANVGPLIAMLLWLERHRERFTATG